MQRIHSQRLALLVELADIADQVEPRPDLRFRCSAFLDQCRFASTKSREGDFRVTLDVVVSENTLFCSV